MRHERIVAISSALAVMVISGTVFGQNSIATAAAESDNLNDEPRTISVTGIASTKVSPDQVSVSFSIETQEETAQNATSSNARITTIVIGALKNANLSDTEISTSYYNVYPVYEFVERPVDCIPYGEDDKLQQYCPPPTVKQILIGYKAVNGIKVQSEQLDRVGLWIDAAVQAGANRVDSVYFYISSESQDAIRFGLINDAVSDAHNRAAAAASSLGMQVTDVLTINLDSYSVIYPKRGYEYAAGAPSPSTPIIPGTEEISASIHATFEIDGYSVERGSTNETITASVGEEFQIALDSNPSTGYRWLVTGIDTTVVTLVNDEYTPSTSGLVGAPGTQVMTFKALAEGQISIKIEYARPWEPQSPENVHYVNVTVAGT